MSNLELEMKEEVRQGWKAIYLESARGDDEAIDETQVDTPAKSTPHAGAVVREKRVMFGQSRAYYNTSNRAHASGRCRQGSIARPSMATPATP
jgi:hypothetical protein